MLFTQTRYRLLSLGLGLAILSACTSVDLNEGTDPDQVDPNAQQQDGGLYDQHGQPFDQHGTGTELTPIDGSNKVDPLEDPNSPLAQRNIYFEFDSFVILPDYQPIIEAHAAYLAANRDKQVVIEGNTDEQGSREYNLALGQKRADAVRRALAALGVDENQMESISFGEEKPRAQGQTEDDFAQNRRADLNYR
ncbi:MAG: peptidoglycan-associated lipoprotein Pal [Lautropia sp.]|nr:peptidoglycan-associated lipoprotein Pal [Lautropia sp.]